MKGWARLLLPLRCLGCGGVVAEVDGATSVEPVCLSCRLRLGAPPAPRCPRCDLPRGTGSGRPLLCGGCEDWPEALERAWTATALEPPADALVHALKYGGWEATAAPMARRMAARLRDDGGLPDGGLLVPIPTTAARRRRRGYDQAARLAEALAPMVGRTVCNALARRPSRASQVALPVDRRRANVHGAFEAGEAAGRIGAHPHTILVDDVLTTGATAAAAARALTDLGARRVFLVAFARTMPRRISAPGA